MKSPPPRSACVAVLGPIGLLLGAMTAAPAHGADPSTYLLLPGVTQGERELDTRYGVGSAGTTTRHQQDAGIGIGLGVGANWFSEIAVQYRRIGRNGTALDGFEWENIVALAEPGQWPVDVALAIEVEQAHDSREGPALRAGPLLQGEYGRFQANLNVMAGRHIHSAEFQATQLRYQAQVKYRYSRPLEVGLQAFGSLGSASQTWSAYADQVHRIGPVVLGRFVLPGERSISYNAGYLLGTSAHSPDRTLRLQLEYEF